MSCIEIFSFTNIFLRFWSIPFITFSLSSNNNIGTPSVPPNSDAVVMPPHFFYTYSTGLLLTLVEIKYQGSSSNPFIEHPVIVMLFLGTKLAYLIVPMASEFNIQINDRSLNLMFVMCHILGIIDCELLLLVLVSPIKWLFINVPFLVLVVATFFCYKYLLQLLNSVETPRSEIHNGQATDTVAVEGEGQATDTVDVEGEAEVPSSVG